ncbi:unnamed protein product [Rhizophagus irregularis]|nr:unnamed protein product [Rhizophagus irregularis]
MKEIKEAINYQEFLKVTKNPPRKLNMELDKLLQDRYNNNSYTLYRRNELVLHKSEDCNGKIKNILDKKWKEEPEKIKEFFKILAVEGNRRFKRSRLLPSPQPSPQPQSLPQPQSQPHSPKKKLPLLLPRPPFPQPRVYYQPRSYEYYSQQLPLRGHYEQCIPTLPLYQPQLQPQQQPQSSPSLQLQPSSPQPYANYQPISYEDNQPQHSLSPPQLQSDHSDEYWKMHQLSDEFYSYRSQQLPLHYYEQSIPAVTLPLYQPQLQPQPQLQSSTSSPPELSLPQPYANYQPISYEDNQPQPLLLPSQLQTDESCCWQMYQSPDEFYYPQPLPLQQPEPLPDDEQYDQPQSPPYELYFNDFD